MKIIDFFEAVYGEPLPKYQADIMEYIYRHRHEIGPIILTIKKEKTMYMIKDTENVKFLELTMNFKFAGQELRHAKLIGGQWAGWVGRPTSVPTSFIPVSVVLEIGDVEEVQPRSLEEVQAEARGRAL